MIIYISSELILQQYSGRKKAFDILAEPHVDVILNIAKLTFTSGVNSASREYEVSGSAEHCPFCGVMLDENGCCRKCGYHRTGNA